jgi:hypothetical protein
MSSLLVFNRVYRLELQSVMLVFSTQLCKRLPLNPSLWFTSPNPAPLLLVKVQVYLYKQCSVWLGAGGGMLSCVGDHTQAGV